MLLRQLVPPGLLAATLALVLAQSGVWPQGSAAARVSAPFPAGIPGTYLFGRVVRASNGMPVPDARVTLYLPDLSVFHERRTDSRGRYLFALTDPGSYRFGIALPGFEYVERDANLAAGSALLCTTRLVPEAHGGAWEVIGDTLPEVLDATDIGVLRPDGTIFYCHDTSDPIVLDPRTGAKNLPVSSGSEQGCMNGTLLEDGSVLLAGGQDGSSPGSFRDAISWVKEFHLDQTWTQLGDMLAPTGRWYPGLARLADGRLLVMGGGTAPSAARTDTCEIYDPSTGAWSFTGSMGSAVEFPPSALLLDGRVLRTWGTIPELYDPSTGAWTPTGAFAFPSRGYPGHSDHSLLVLSDGRAAAIGIRRLEQPSAPMVEFFDSVTEAWTPGSSPDRTRMQCEVVLLPDGRVLVQGGDQETTAGPEPNVLGIVKRCDLFDPGSEAWRRVADTLVFREYHAVTLLVPDGRVVTTGGTRIKFQVGPTSSNVDAYSPPYLFRGVRPRIGSVSDTTPARGTTLSFDVFPETALTSVVLLGMQSTTHWVDGGIPRRVELPVSQSGTDVQVVLPSDQNALPLGWYLLFAMVDDIPSEGVVVRVDA